MALSGDMPCEQYLLVVCRKCRIGVWSERREGEKRRFAEKNRLKFPQISPIFFDYSNFSYVLSHCERFLFFDHFCAVVQLKIQESDVVHID